MTASKRSISTFGADLCKVALFFVGAALFIQALDNIFYRVPFDRLFMLGTALILIFALRVALRATARVSDRRPGFANSAFVPAVVPVRVRR